MLRLLSRAKIIIRTTFELSINNNTSNRVIIIINKIRDNRRDDKRIRDGSIQSQSFVLCSLFGEEEGASFSSRRNEIER